MHQLNDSQIKVIQADGTFKCVPDKNTGFYQLLVVKAIVKGESMPVLHVILTGKSEILYTKVTE